MVNTRSLYHNALLLFVFGRLEYIASHSCYHRRSDLLQLCGLKNTQTHTFSLAKLLLSHSSRSHNSPPTLPPQTFLISMTLAPFIFSILYFCCLLLLLVRPLSVCFTLFLFLPLSVVGSLPGTVHIPGWKIRSFVQTPASKICPEKSHMAVSTLQTSPFTPHPQLLHIFTLKHPLFSYFTPKNSPSNLP